MANPKRLSVKGSLQAAQANGFEDEHDLKNSQGYGRSEADMYVDIDNNEIVLQPTGTNASAVVRTGMFTTARGFVCSKLLDTCCLQQVSFCGLVKYYDFIY